MLLFMDTEFTGLHKNTTLISLAIVDEEGKSFYAELTDYDSSQVDDWVHDNVIKNLLWDGYKRIDSDTEEQRSIKGNKKEVGSALAKWLDKYSEVQFVSDVCHYDFVLLIDLFGGALDLPEKVSPYCIDINQEIARFYKVSCKEAFDMSREGICGENGEKHNSYWDAKIIKRVYDIVKMPEDI